MRKLIADATRLHVKRSPMLPSDNHVWFQYTGTRSGSCLM